jgi:hypothetical protein
MGDTQRSGRVSKCQILDSPVVAASELGRDERNAEVTRDKTTARKRTSMQFLAASFADAWIGKVPHRVLYHCTTSQTGSGRVAILKKEYQHEYFFILENGLNQPAAGHMLFK